MNVVVWRGRNSVNVMAAKADSVVILSAMKELKLYDEGVRATAHAVREKRIAERKDREAATAATTTATEAAASPEKVDATADA